MPGASKVAGQLRRLADRIDEVVAGQLWMQICGHSPDDSSYVAKKILGRTLITLLLPVSPGLGDR